MKIQGQTQWQAPQGFSQPDPQQLPQQNPQQYPQQDPQQYPQQNPPQYPQQNAPQYPQQNAPQYSPQSPQPVKTGSGKGSSGKKGEKLILMVLVLLGIGFIVLGLFLYRSKSGKLARYKRVTATIVKLEEKTDRDGFVDYYPYVKYEVNGEEYVTRLSTSVNKDSKYKKIEIAYDPDDPKKITTTDSDAFDGIFFGGLGALFLVLGLLMLFQRTDGKKKKNGPASGG